MVLKFVNKPRFEDFEGLGPVGPIKFGIEGKVYTTVVKMDFVLLATLNLRQVKLERVREKD